MAAEGGQDPRAIPIATHPGEVDLFQEAGPVLKPNTASGHTSEHSPGLQHPLQKPENGEEAILGLRSRDIFLGAVSVLSGRIFPGRILIAILIPRSSRSFWT